MAQKKLPTYNHHRSLTLGIALALFLSFFGCLQGCVNAQDNKSLGMTLLFTNKGAYSIGVHRFDPDGQRGPAPGALGVGGSKQMTFMVGDIKHGMSQVVEVEWSIETPEIQSLRKKRDQAFSDYSKFWMNETDRINALAPRHISRINLTPILTTELLAQVRANRQNTHLKLKVIFTDGEVTITAAPEVWR